MRSCCHGGSRNNYHHYCYCYGYDCTATTTTTAPCCCCCCCCCCCAPLLLRLLRHAWLLLPKGPALVQETVDGTLDELDPSPWYFRRLAQPSNPQPEGSLIDHISERGGCMWPDRRLLARHGSLKRISTASKKILFSTVARKHGRGTLSPMMLYVRREKAAEEQNAVSISRQDGEFNRNNHILANSYGAVMASGRNDGFEDCTRCRTL